MSSRVEVISVEESHPQERLDTYLRSRFNMVSRGTLQRLISQGHIRINGLVVKPTYRLRSGDSIRVHWPEPKSAEAKPEEIPLDILHEDADVLVLNKPSGLVTHPSVGHEEHTLVNALLHHCRGSLSGIGGVARPGIVHRLDKDTSGCLIVAKHDAAHLALAVQFKQRSIIKSYRAIVVGVIRSDRGEIRAAVQRHPSHRKKMAVSGGTGREAWTSYRVLERLRSVSYVEAVLHTGRTHQIRVHFQHLGFPLLGDSVYGSRQTARLAEECGYRAPRQMLHAHRLTFVHPGSGETLTLEAELPSDFQEALAVLRRG